MGEYKKNISTKVFTEEEEMSLLEQILIDREFLCLCISCSMNALKDLAYRVVRKNKRPYPKSWNKNQQMISAWLQKFKARHSDIITNLFSHVCEAEFIQASTKKQQFPFKEIFTLEEEQKLLTYIKIIKTSCICRNCTMIKVTVAVYKAARDMGKYYPASWDKDERAGSDWMEGFEKRHRNEISELSPVCQAELFQWTSQQQSSSKEIFTWLEEQSLLEVAQIVVASVCDCVTCSLKELQILAYKAACDMNKSYPESWDKEQRAGCEWLKEFVDRHNSEISKFPCVCTNGGNSTSD